MRCGTAREWLTSAIDGELTARQRHELDAHLAGCPACTAERRQTARLLGALSTLAADTTLPPRLEQDTLRRVRQLAAEEAERATEPGRVRFGRWLGLGLPALAAAAVVVLALRSAVPPPAPGPVASVAPETTRESQPAPPPAPAARRPAPVREKPPVAVARQDPPAAASDDPAEAPATLAKRDADPARAAAPADARPGEDLPNEPPPELIARPDLFRDLPILQNMEKLQNYDAIETTTVDAPHRGPNG